MRGRDSSRERRDCPQSPILLPGRAMRSFILVWILAYAVGTNGVPSSCPPGEQLSGGSCVQCPAGTYKGNEGSGSCTPAQPGWYAPDRIHQTQCGPGNWSPGGTSFCSQCPRGSMCPSSTTSQPQPCSPGEYQPDLGMSTCRWCPRGTFGTQSGATSCCTCCQGFYTDQEHQNHCFPCVDNGKTGSPAGATDKSQCTSPTVYAPVQSCQMSGPNQCPGTVPPPVGSPVPGRRSLKEHCRRGFKRCPIISRRGMSTFECVHVASDLESCGGCMSFDGSPSEGQDCTLIEGTNGVECYRGSCLIHSCRSGYVMSANGQLCVARDIS